MIRQWALRRAERLMASRPPDFSIGPKNDRYMLRWFVIPRNRWFNVYLHRFLHDDDDEALHDHPWWSVSWLLRHGYYEVLRGPIPETERKTEFPYRSVWRAEGSVTFRRATTAHRIVLDREPVDKFGDELKPPKQTISLFFTGPVRRVWGFHCPKGWIPFTEFTNVDEGSSTGKGCP